MERWDGECRALPAVIIATFLRSSPRMISTRPTLAKKTLCGEACMWGSRYIQKLSSWVEPTSSLPSHLQLWKERPFQCVFEEGERHGVTIRFRYKPGCGRCDCLSLGRSDAICRKKIACAHGRQRTVPAKRFSIIGRRQQKLGCVEEAQECYEQIQCAPPIKDLGNPIRRARHAVTEPL